MRTRFALLAVVAAVLVAVCPVASGHGAPGPSVAAPVASGVISDAVPIPAGMSVSPLPADTPLEISLTLAYPHPAALAAFLSAVESPNSPDYRAYLTHEQFEQAFAPGPAAVGTVVAALRGAGGHEVTVAPDHLSVTAQLDASSVDALLGVRMVYLPGPGDPRWYTASGTPTLPSGLDGLVSGVSGLSDSADARLTLNLGTSQSQPAQGPTSTNQFVVNNTTGQQWFVGSDFTQAFDLNELFPGSSVVANATYPTDVAIATLLASGYNETTGNNTPPWDPAVIQTYFNATFAPGWPRSNLTGVPVNISGISPPLPGSFGGVGDDTLDEFENSLDLEMAGSLAPGAPLYNFYFAGSLLASAVSDANAATYFDQDLASALSYNYSPNHLGVVSASFGLDDLNDSTWNAELEEAAAMGVTVVAASGDSGNAPNSLTERGSQWPLWPASASFNSSGVLSVGGVSLSASGTPNGWANGMELNVSYGSGFGGLTGLSAWWDTTGGPGNYVGTEGGISSVYPEPYWQLHSAAQPNIVNATIVQGIGSLGRAGPDVAFPANVTLAAVFANSTGTVFFELLAGTSIAAPAFAGFLADEIAVAHHSFGFIGPEIYRIESYYAANPGPTNPFYDVVTGANYEFAAGPGWDATTGWGTPIAPLFYLADANSTIRNYTYLGPTPGLPPVPPTPPVPWTEIYLIFGVGAVVAIVLIVAMARPSKQPDRPPPSTFGPLPPPPPASLPAAMYSGPTFLCPYCGALRPAEPVRCPKCGAI
ncbi:MAG: protease pro-enzyme activation domain-containing protein [Thermoplasmata archaeon]